jgi:general stress protein 26
MEQDEQKLKILEFLKSQPLGVVSTVRSGEFPQAALVGITETEGLDLIFGTSKLSRKYSNLKSNPQVAVVIVNSEQKATLQYEGVAEELQGDEQVTAREIHIAKHPGSKRHLQDPQEVFFKIVPRWMRYSNYGSAPHEIFEIKF